MTDHPKITDRIMQAVGGVDNIKSLSHCATRLRFVLIDKTKFNTQQLEQIPEVLSAVSSGDESQVVVGAKVTLSLAKLFVAEFEMLVELTALAETLSERLPASDTEVDSEVVLEACVELAGIVAVF
ncbi:hypothetical protein BGL52_05300 [Lacticaseibacillus casei]|uniref:PTS EIIB type-1 domain-containing protein n=1 Tax=Lacticaseibacillus casei TaxID=1582 RepID=A0AAN1C7H3_LACCA|nr:hypothetical protein BGL52_05300 [Lacticaseibacillus casei]